jgi:hypothetical protein
LIGLRKFVNNTTNAKLHYYYTAVKIAL